MQTEYRIKDKGGGISFSCITDTKFKSNSIFVRFLTDFCDDDAAALAMIPAVLTSCNKYYPEGTEFLKRLNSLYGTGIIGMSGFKGDGYEICLSVEYLADRYALDGDKISKDAAQLLLDCIFEPAAENNGFAESEFNLRKNDLLDAIDSEINDKISYALNLSYETVFEGEISAKKYYGSRKAVEAVTPQKAYEVYVKLLNEAKIEVSFCGCGDFKEANALFAEAFKNDRVSFKNPAFISYSKAKNEPAYVEKHMDVSQANIVMAFKAGGGDLMTAQMLTAIYGGSTFSKLFVNVREKMSLCYFCTASYSEAKGTMLVVSAVEPDNIEKAKNEIIRQLECIAEGDFTEENFISAKRYLASGAMSKNDRISSLDAWYSLGLARGKVISVSDYVKMLGKVTREDIAALAAKMKLDTVFVLKNSEEA